MKNKLVIGAFILMTAVFVCVLLLPPDRASFESENRAMSAMPEFNAETVFSGEFASGFEKYLGDSAAFRSFFLDLNKLSGDIKGFAPDTGKIISTTKDIGTGTTQKQTLLVANNAIMEMFMRNTAREEDYADAVNHYARKLPKDVTLYNMIVPTQLEFQEPMYKNLQDSQQDAIESIYEKLDKNVKTVDAYGAIKDHADEYVYFRTDHHWTPLGAYYAYRSFIRLTKQKSCDRNSYEVNKIPNFLGYLYDRAESSDFDILPDTIEWYDVDKDDKLKITMYSFDDNNEPHAYKGTMYDSTKANYQFFFGSDHALIEMVNDNVKDGTLAVIKESYSNALAPWLIESYHKVILVDPRIYKGNFEYVLDKYSPDDVLIADYIFTTNFADYCDILRKMY